MDKLTEYIGLYDIWVVLYPGTVGTLETVLFSGMMYSVLKKQHAICRFLPREISDWVLFIISAVFLGIILQEMGRWLRRATKVHCAEDRIFDSTGGVFGNNEIARFKEYFVSQGWDGKDLKNARLVFHCINIDSQECDVAKRFVKLNVIQNVSINLAAAMLLGLMETITVTIVSIVQQNVFLASVTGIGCVLYILLIIILIRRSYRFNRYWVRNIVYAMASHSTLMGKKEDEKNDRERN